VDDVLGGRFPPPEHVRIAGKPEARPRARRFCFGYRLSRTAWEILEGQRMLSRGEFHHLFAVLQARPCQVHEIP
jgi:hypothetical protein